MTFHRIKEEALPSLTFKSEPHCGGRVSEGKDFYTFYFIVLLSKAHFVCLVAYRLFHFEKLLFIFVKAENIVIHILIHTIQLIYSAKKSCPLASYTVAGMSIGIVSLVSPNGMLLIRPAPPKFGRQYSIIEEILSSPAGSCGSQSTHGPDRCCTELQFSVVGPTDPDVGATNVEIDGPSPATASSGMHLDQNGIQVKTDLPEMAAAGNGFLNIGSHECRISFPTSTVVGKWWVCPGLLTWGVWFPKTAGGCVGSRFCGIPSVLGLPVGKDFWSFPSVSWGEASSVLGEFT